MVLTNDIYFKVDSSIVNRDFWEVNIEEKKQLIDSELKKYIILKIKELGNNTSMLNDEKNNTSVNDLLKILASIIPEEDHFETLRHFVHYVIQVAGSLQNYAICWWIEEEEKLIDIPVVEFVENGLWSNLKTHKETNYIKTFDFVYDVFTNQFMTKSNTPKELVFNKSTK